MGPEQGRTGPDAAGRVAVLRDYGEPLELRTYDVREPGPGAILLKVTEASICGSDLHMWRGDTDGIPIPHGGRAMGHEGTGTVEALGPDVTTDSLGRRLEPGDRVVHSIIVGCSRCESCLRGDPNLCSRKPPAPSVDDAPHFFGTFSDFHYLRPGTPVFRVPDELPSEILAPVNCAMGTVMEGLVNAGVRPGHSVVLQGAGGLGLAGAALAKDMGAQCVIVLDRIEGRLQLAREFGADHALNVDDFADAAERVAAVRELTGGRGVDAVLELVGIPELLPEGLAMLRNGGTYVEVGLFFPGRSISFDASTVVMSGKRIVGSNGYHPLVLPSLLDFLTRTHRSRPFDKLISHRFSLSDINQAFRSSEWQQQETPVIRAVVVP